MATFQEIIFNAAVALKAEAVTACITLVIGLLMWFASTPVRRASHAKKCVDEEEGPTPALVTIREVCHQCITKIVQSSIARCVAGLMTVCMLASCLKVCGAFAQPLVVLPVAFVLGGLARFLTCKNQDGEADYPEGEGEEQLAGNDACPHSAAFWAELEPAETKTEEPPLEPSEILSDVLLPLLADAAVAPVLRAQQATPCTKKGPAPVLTTSTPFARLFRNPTVQCITGTIVVFVIVISLHLCGAFAKPILVLPMGFVLGGLARWLICKNQEDEEADYPEDESDEHLTGNDACPYSAAFWVELEPAQTKTEEMPLESSEILSDVLLQCLDDPVVASIMRAR